MLKKHSVYCIKGIIKLIIFPDEPVSHLKKKVSSCTQ